MRVDPKGLQALPFPTTPAFPLPGAGSSTLGDTLSKLYNDATQRSDDDRECCEELYRQMKAATKELFSRYEQARKNRRGFLPGGVDDLGHREQYENVQNRLRSLIRQATEKNCPVPPEALEWQNTSYPDIGQPNIPRQPRH